MRRNEVRSMSGTPVAADFYNSDGTPIVIDVTEGKESVFLLNDAGNVVDMATRITSHALTLDFLLMGG